MTQLSLIQALTGNIPGQGANGKAGQGLPENAQAGSGTILFASLLGQGLAQTPSGQASKDGSPDGASALLDVTTGAAAGQSLLANAVSTAATPGEPGLEGNIEGQVLFGLVDRAETEAARAAENSPVLAAVLADDGSTVFAAGPNEQNIPAPFVSSTESDSAVDTDILAVDTDILAVDTDILAVDTDILAVDTDILAVDTDILAVDTVILAVDTDILAADSDIINGVVVGRLPAQASATAAPASGKERASASAPSSSEEGEIENALAIALSIAPVGEAVSAAAKSFGPAEAPAAPPSAVARGEVAALDAPKIARPDGDNQSRAALAPKAGGEAQANFESNAGGSGDLDGNGQQNGAPTGTGNKKGLGAEAGNTSASGRGIKSSVGAGHANANIVAELPAGSQPSGQLQSHITPLRALENSMALNAGLVLPFNAAAPLDPMTGTATSLSAQSLATGIQTLQASISVSGAAHSSASLAHSPNFVANQVGLQITRAIADGNNEFTIRLNPPEMGRVEVRLEFSADGGVRAALFAEKPETLNLLQRDAAALERALNDAGVKTDSGSLNFSLQRDEAQAGEQGANSASETAAMGDEAGEDYPQDAEIEITEQIIQQMVADGAVDIRV